MCVCVCVCVGLVDDSVAVVFSALGAQGAALTLGLHHSYVDHARPQDAPIWSTGGVDSLFPVTKRHTMCLHNFQ